jgi:hypothetical protein
MHKDLTLDEPLNEIGACLYDTFNIPRPARFNVMLNAIEKNQHR